jgi:Mce-associated membrane protein
MAEHGHPPEELSEADETRAALATAGPPDDTSPGSPSEAFTDDEANGHAASSDASAADCAAGDIDDDVEDYDAAADDDVETDAPVPAKTWRTPVRVATAFGLVTVVALASIVGYLGYRANQAREVAQEQQQFVQVGRQGALNLTTIDWEHADHDIQRILDSATGAFYDDFSKRSQPFIDVVRKEQSKSVGTITEAGFESQSHDEAQILVGITVKTSNISAAEQDPRHWRMRITVKKLGDALKVSNVAFVP